MTQSRASFDSKATASPSAQPLRGMFATWRGEEFFRAILAGAATAAVVLLARLKLDMPGHQIVVAAFPAALGLAGVRRRGAGLITGGVTGITASVASAAGWTRVPLAAGTSITLLAPLLDLARGRTSRPFLATTYFALSGCGANVAALAVRAASQWFLFAPSTAKGAPIGLTVVASYCLFGLLAGLIAAGIVRPWRDAPQRHSVKAGEPG